MRQNLFIFPGSTLIKLLTTINYECSLQVRVFVPSRPLKAFSNNCKQGPSQPGCSTFSITLGQTLGLTHIHETRLERPDTDKRSSLL
jgi:hypothetical protein